MDLSKETERKIQDLQALESNLNTLLMQKQNYQVELNELTNALGEVKKSEGDVYKVSSNIMIKANKPDVLKNLEEKKKMIEMKITSIEKQETIFEDKASKIRTEVNTEITKNK